jgi:hypothetical protein
MSIRIRDPRLLDSRYSAIGYRPSWWQRYIVGEQGRNILGINLQRGESFAVSQPFPTAVLAACVAPAVPGARAKNPLRSADPDYTEFYVYVTTANGSLWQLDRDSLAVIDEWDVGSSADHRWLIPGLHGIAFPGQAPGEIAMFDQITRTVMDRRVVVLSDSVVLHWVPGEADRFYVFDDRGHGQVIDWNPITAGFVGRARFAAPAAVDILDTFVDSAEAYIYYPAPRELTILARGPRGDGVRATYDLTDQLAPVETIKSFAGSEYQILSGAGAFPGRVGTRRDGGQFPQLPWWPGPAAVLAPQDPGADRHVGAGVVASSLGDAWIIPDDAPTPAFGISIEPIIPYVDGPFPLAGGELTIQTTIPYQPILTPGSFRAWLESTPPTPGTIVIPSTITAGMAGNALLTFAAPLPAHAGAYVMSVAGTNGSSDDSRLAFFYAAIPPSWIGIADGVATVFDTNIPWEDDMRISLANGQTVSATMCAVAFDPAGYGTFSSTRKFYTETGTNIGALTNNGGFVRLTTAVPPPATFHVAVHRARRTTSIQAPAGGPWTMRVRIRAMVEPSIASILGPPGTGLPVVFGSPSTYFRLNPGPPNTASDHNVGYGTLDWVLCTVGADSYWFNSTPTPPALSLYEEYDYVAEIPIQGGETATFVYDVRTYPRGTGGRPPQTVLAYRDFNAFLPPDDDGGTPFSVFDATQGRIGVAVQIDVLAFIPVD